MRTKPGRDREVYHIIRCYFSLEVLESAKYKNAKKQSSNIQYWTERIAQTALLWNKTTLITDGVGGAGEDPSS